jgi:hypothetical protein
LVKLVAKLYQIIADYCGLGAGDAQTHLQVEALFRFEYALVAR